MVKFIKVGSWVDRFNIFFCVFDTFYNVYENFKEQPYCDILYVPYYNLPIGSL